MAHIAKLPPAADPPSEPFGKALPLLRGQEPRPALPQSIIAHSQSRCAVDSLRLFHDVLAISLQYRSAIEMRSQ